MQTFKQFFESYMLPSSKHQQLCVVFPFDGEIWTKEQTKVFNKIRINKFIPLSIAIVLTASIFVMNYAFKINYFILNSVIMILVVFSFSWFLEIVETGGPKVEKKIVIKPKAKPNRVKNMNKNKNK